jgi:hypothetical protein
MWNEKMLASYLHKHSMNAAGRWFVLTSAE